MKKGFLQTFIVLGVFSIFLIGNFSPVSADTNRTEVKEKREVNTWPQNGKTYEGANIFYNDGSKMTIGREVGSKGLYKTTFTRSDGTPMNVGYSDVSTIDEGVKKGEQYSKSYAAPKEERDKAAAEAKKAHDQAATAAASATAGEKDGAFANGVQTLIMMGLIYGSVGISWLVSLTGWLFDQVIAETTKYPQYLQEGIYNSWKIVRDLSNIVLVFSLLYLGIKTILEGQGFADKKVLIGIIIAAILINFSLFFVKDVAFNISNTVGLQVLEQARVKQPTTSSTGTRESYSAGLMEIVNPQKVLALYGFNGEWSATAVAVNSRTGYELVFKMMGNFILFTAIVVSLGFIFVGASVILLYRFVIFIALMIASPFGLVSTQIPWLKKHGSTWFDHLKKQTLFFPAFALVLYLVLLIVTTLAASSPVTTLSSQSAMFQFVFNFLLIMSFMIGLLIIPGKLSVVGSELMGKSGGYLKNKIKSLPRSGGQFGGRVIARTGAQTGRYLVGNKFANLYGGNSEDKVKELQRRAQGTGFNAWRAQQRLKGSEKLKDKTYDLRNIDAIKKTKFGKGMGEGIQSYTKTIKQKSDDFEKKKKEEMKRYGFDKLHETDEAKMKLRRVEAVRSSREEEYLAAEAAFKASGSDADLAEMNRSEKKLKDAELLTGKIKNTGENKYLEQNTKQWKTKLNVLMSSTTRDTAKKIREDTDKKWKEAGQSSDKKKKRAESVRVERDLSTPTTSPPATPPTTP
jgi:hypothetical protein